MSAPNRSIIVARAARDDLRGILAYTEMQWGPNQRQKYRARINDAFDQIASFPFKGRARDDISKGLRSIPVDQYMIYYRVAPRSVMIRRIVHSKSDISDEHGLGLA